MSITELDKLSNLQAYSGLAFSTFTALHLTNHFVAVVSKDISQHTKWMHLFRKYYQSPVIEIGMLSALGVHIYANVRIVRFSLNLQCTVYYLPSEICLI